MGELLQPGAVRPADDAARGGSRSTARIGSRTSTPCAVLPERRPASTRCSCTSRSPGSSARIFLIWLGFRFRARGCGPGDLLLVFFIWYGTTRFILENLRADNWTFFGIPTAQIVSLAGDPHRRRRSDLSASARTPGRPAAGVPAARDVGCARRRMDDATDRRAVGERAAAEGGGRLGRDHRRRGRRRRRGRPQTVTPTRSGSRCATADADDRRRPAAGPRTSRRPA